MSILLFLIPGIIALIIYKISEDRKRSKIDLNIHEYVKTLYQNETKRL